MGMIARGLAAALGLIGGVAASQGPEFGQQYRQRLGGAVDELQRIADRFDGEARALGQTREEALRRLGGNPDELARRQGAGVAADVARLERLRRHRDEMAAAGPFERLVVLMVGVDPEIARAAYREFEPAIPTTQEGAIAAGVGFTALWGGTLLAGGLARRARRRPPHRRPGRVMVRRDPDIRDA